MAKQKKLNWAAIKKRYLQGEKPKDIAVDYGLTAKQVSDKASYEGWIRKKTEISEKVATDVEDDLKALCSATIKVHRLFMERMLQKNRDGQDMIQALEHPFLMDGEKVNGLYQTAMNNSVKLYQTIVKVQDDAPAEEEPPGFNVSPDA